MNRLQLLRLCLLSLIFMGLPACTPVPSGSDAGGDSEGAPVGGSGGFTRIDETARFLAGLPGGGDSRVRQLRATAEWQAHAARMDQQFGVFDRGYLPKVRAFRGELGGLTSPGVLFYPFSGPDYLYARGFFPGAGSYVLVGQEGVDALPDLASLSDGEILAGLGGLSHSLKSLTGASYFITKDMRVDFASTRFRGVLPILLTMIARSGQSISSVDPVGLSPSGGLTSRAGGAGCPGWHIVAGGRHIYYFQEDLSNGTLGGDKRLLSFVRSKGAPVTFVKSASYLMHSDGFSVIRNFVVNESRGILQDSSGVPYRILNASNLSLSLYGNYTGPLDVFSERRQDDLIAAYRDRSPHPVKPLDFGVGYLRNPATACLIVARR
ncbi:MAG: hypothetical protein JNK37_14040 [Verrucomicrobiales bacterium]|nr:hypothetical protein [Verrucomicrobiales bacterium]